MDNTDQRLSLDEEIQDEAEMYNHLMHIASYKFAQQFAKDKKVLDYGCGSGYGSFLLSSVALNVVGVDIDNEAIEKAQNAYSANNLKYSTIKELVDTKFDVIISFQVIEHVTNVKEYLEKLKRMLNPGGYLLISTPNRTNRLFRYIQKPWNLYHLTEYSPERFSRILNKYFQNVQILKIGSRTELVDKEIARTKKLRIVTLPCTLFFYPNFIRVFLLNQIASLYNFLNHYRTQKHSHQPKSKLTIDFKNKYSANDIEISNEIAHTTDLMAVCIMSTH
jgi:2-polyprenyl-3-methyl-5-hydroxy-6-metoxy-1,4-benzoquinol methylase